MTKRDYNSIQDNLTLKRKALAELITAPKPQPKIDLFDFVKELPYRLRFVIDSILISKAYGDGIASGEKCLHQAAQSAYKLYNKAVSINQDK